MDPFADNVVEFNHPFSVMPFDIHKGIHAVVGLCIAGVDIFHLVTVVKQAVYASLQQGIGDDIMPDRFVARAENTDPFANPSVETIRTRIKTSKNTQGVLELHQH